jgi:hypothetical protein
MTLARICWGYVTRWQTTILFAALGVLFAGGLWSNAVGRREDARIERAAALRTCETGNERTAVIRDFILAASQDPDPRQYEFIADPKLREGALEQTKRARAEQRDRTTRTFQLRDCAAELPPPP